MQRPQEAPPASNLAQLGAWGFGVLCVLAVACLFPVGGRGANPFGSAAQQQASLNLHLDTYPELVQSGQQVPSKAASKNQAREQTRNISNGALPLHHYWREEEAHHYTPQQLLDLATMFPAARQLHERYERLALVAKDAAELVSRIRKGIFTDKGEVIKGAILVMHMSDAAPLTPVALDLLLTANAAKADTDPSKFKVGRLSDYLIEGYSQIDRGKSLKLK